jgi:hypothetical protein
MLVPDNIGIPAAVFFADKVGEPSDTVEIIAVIQGHAVFKVKAAT